MASRIAMLIVMVAVAYGLSGCSDKDSKYRGQFLSSCIKAGSSKAVCSCDLDKLAKEYNGIGNIEIVEAMATVPNPDSSTVQQYKDLLKSGIKDAQECRVEHPY